MGTILESAVGAGLSLAALPAALACTLPEGYAEGAAPAIDPARLIAHVETVRIEAPLDRTLEIIDAMSLEDSIAEDTSLPGVAETHDLTPGAFGDEARAASSA